jgi:NTP pyrophosphatase (non-canonical NTP hydrolase)
MIDLEQFKKDAIRTESRIEAVHTTKLNVVAALNAVVAATEILDQVKKNVFYGKPVKTGAREQALKKLHESSHQLSTMTDLDEKVEHIDVNARIFHHIIGIITESGELAETLLKIINEQQTDHVNLREECGDLNWYVAGLLDELDANFEQVLHKVIEKLRTRYPDKFDSDKAINRDIDEERRLLEK